MSDLRHQWQPAELPVADLGLLPALHIVLDGTAWPVHGNVMLEEVAEAYRSEYGWPVTVAGDGFDAPYAAPAAGLPPYQPYTLTRRRCTAGAPATSSARATLAGRSLVIRPDLCNQPGTWPVAGNVVELPGAPRVMHRAIMIPRAARRFQRRSMAWAADGAVSEGAVSRPG